MGFICRRKVDKCRQNTVYLNKVKKSGENIYASSRIGDGNRYRYNDAARDEFIKVIKFYKERLWIPYQVGLEFHRRREDIMRKKRG